MLDNKNLVKVILDMDGVVADFMTALCTTHKLPSPYENGYEEYGIENSPEFAHMSLNQVLKPCREARWWENVPKMPEADDIVEACLDLVNIDQIVVCTATTQPTGPCVDGKISWWQKHYPETRLDKRVIGTPHKHFLASPTSILVDDKESNIDLFLQHGGNAIMVPQPWNRMRRHVKDFNFRTTLQWVIKVAEEKAARWPESLKNTTAS